ncbi:hypothetical protein BCD67_18875 [Oscillatoriales cyanobacterium USR001]|nr:hypothetical protein BCD67_18875 [Oscillatoriales cyanobacterium USR001]
MIPMKKLSIMVGSSLVVALGLSIPTPANAASLTIADSVSEFSGTQGQNNWYYGYYDRSLTSTDFKQMTQFNGTWFVQQGTYLSLLASTGGHPNGKAPTGYRLPVIQWVVRRWVSEVDGDIQILGNLAKSDTYFNGRQDSITGSIFINGVPIWSQYIAPNDGYGVNYNLNTAITKGSFVDFAINPNGNDLNDTTRFTATITTDVSESEPVPEPTTILGTLAFSTFAARWRMKRKQQQKSLDSSVV